MDHTITTSSQPFLSERFIFRPYDLDLISICLLYIIHLSRHGGWLHEHYRRWVGVLGFPRSAHVTTHATRSEPTHAAGIRGCSSTDLARGVRRSRRAARSRALGRATTLRGRQRWDHGFRLAGVEENRRGQKNWDLINDTAEQILLHLSKTVRELKNENVELNRELTSLTVPLADYTIRPLVPGTNPFYVARLQSLFFTHRYRSLN